MAAMVPPWSEQALPGPGQDKTKAERILKILAKVFQHDLPNQLVVFQGLVQLLELEEKERLTSQALEYLQRMKAVSQRTLNLGRYIKELSYLAGKEEIVERVHLASLVQEFKAQAKHTFTDCQLEWKSSLEITQLTVGRQNLIKGLVELMRLTFSLAGGKSFHINFQARAEVGFDLLQLDIIPGEVLKDPLPTEAKTWEGRLEFLLARELLASGGGTLQLGTEKGPGVEFFLKIPG
jgi:signal transduction histidine kinase